MTVAEQSIKGTILRVRLSPNSSSCKVNGIFINADGAKYLKISVISIPEKGKANKELINFLAKKLKIAKSDIEIISGDTDRMKKVLLAIDLPNVLQWLQSEESYNAG